MTNPTNSALHMMEGRPSVPLAVSVAISAYGDARADDDGTSAARLGECINEIRNAMAAAVAKTALSHFADEVEASGEAEKQAVEQAAMRMLWDDQQAEEKAHYIGVVARFAIPPSSDVATLQRELNDAYEGFTRERGITKELAAQRDELLVALKDLLAVYQAMGNPRGPKEIIAEAAITKATTALSKVQQP